MKKASLFAAVACFAAFGALAQNRSVKFETGSFADVLAKAKKENKPIVMDGYTTWCGPCKWMDKKVFVNDTVADFINANFIPFKSDMEKGEGKELAKRYEVQAYPNFVFIAPDGSVLHRAVGSRPPAAFVEAGKDALNPTKRYAYYQKRYEGGDRDPEFLAQYVTIKGNAALDNTTEMNAYFATQKDADLLARRNWKRLHDYTRSTDAPEFKRFLKQREAFAKTYTQDSVDQFILTAFARDFAVLSRKPDPAKESQLKADLAKLKVKDANKLLWNMEAEAYRKKSDMKNYGITAAKLVDTYYLADPGMLNKYAWSFYESVTDKALLEKAETWSNKAVSLYPDYALMDTHAALLYKLGKKKEARTAAENAIAAGKKTGQDVAETEALLKKINEMK
jgi:thiol-disulfide isomerase/thioredoxin